jgi:hypothetical protein
LLLILFLRELLFLAPSLLAFTFALMDSCRLGRSWLSSIYIRWTATETANIDGIEPSSSQTAIKLERKSITLERKSITQLLERESYPKKTSDVS